MPLFKKHDSPPPEPPLAKRYPADPDSYQLFEEIGQGSSASVYRALCTPLNEVVAIKILDFEHGDANNITRESKTMTLVDHPNVLKAYCSFVRDQNVWVVMPFMDGGSCLHILKAAFPDGFCETVIATILHEVLKGLVYLHDLGLIHRDIKAGNILVNGHGAIKLGDLGVSAWLFDSGDRKRSRNTFVGTPCWMAPEVMQQLYGYDFKADIWSFGITALELAHGHAPFSKYPPHKVLLMTLQNAPPGLDYESDKKFSKSFRQMIAMCLVKEPSKRPCAKKLLKHPFFKSAKTSESIVRKLLDGLPTLGKRMESLKIKEASLLAEKKVSYGKKEEISQIEYKKGVTDWNFNLQDIKAEASLIHDDEETSPDKGQGSSSTSLSELDIGKESSPCQSSTACHCLMKSDTDEENGDPLQNKAAALPLHGLALKNLKDSSTEYDDNMNIVSSDIPLQNVTSAENETGKYELGITAEHSNDVSIHSPLNTGASSSRNFHDQAHSHVEESSDKKRFQVPDSVNCNGALDQQAVVGASSILPVTKDDEHTKKSEGKVVQQKGRFKVTCENIDIEKGLPLPPQQNTSNVQLEKDHNAAELIQET